MKKHILFIALFAQLNCFTQILNDSLIMYLSFDGTISDASRGFFPKDSTGHLAKGVGEQPNTAFLTSTGFEPLVFENEERFNITASSEFSYSMWLKIPKRNSFWTNVIFAKGDINSLGDYMNLEYGLINPNDEMEYINGEWILKPRIDGGNSEDGGIDPYGDGFFFPSYPDHNGYVTTDIINNQWDHYVITYNQNGWKLYKNSILVSSNDLIDGLISNTHPLNIGASSDSLFIDEFYFFNKSLSESEISSLYNLNNGTDLIAPVVDYSSFNSDLSFECVGNTPNTPIANDNVDGIVTGTTITQFPVTATTEVIWTFTDNAGNTSTTMQRIVIEDNIAPVADASTFNAELNFECSGGTPNAPRANDNCDGIVIGTTTTQFPVYETTQVTWTFTDNAGNSSTTTQNIIISDQTAPTPDVIYLPTIVEECAVSNLAQPTATDNCSGNVTATHNATLPITENTTITWTYEDASGNTSTQIQEVFINHTIVPSLDFTELETLIGDCQISNYVVPTATTYCGQTITGTANINLPTTDTSVHEITWIFTDAFNNSISQTQIVEWEMVPEITQATTTGISGEITLFVENINTEDYMIQWIACDNNEIHETNTPDYTPTNSGTYKAVVSNNDCEFETECVNVELLISNLSTLSNSNRFNTYPNPVNDMLNISSTSDAVISIYSTNGVLILETTNKTINVSQLKAGIYIIKQNDQTAKLVKK
jgi:hypothetical protein